MLKPMEPQTIQSSVAAQLVPLANPSLIFLLVSMYGKLLFYNIKTYP
nr:MAG TPA: hypothetical protein [Caudoviricetes sp.]